MGILTEDRRRIVQNAPHLVTATGDLLSFRTDLAIKPEVLTLSYVPKYSREGTPAPDNVIPITGYTEITMTVNGVTYTKNTPSTSSRLTPILYGASINVMNPNYWYITFSHWAWESSGIVASNVTSIATLGSYTRFWLYFSGQARKAGTMVMCDTLPSAANVGYGEYSRQENKIGVSDDYKNSLWLIMPTSLVGTTAESIAQYVTAHPIIVVYERGSGGNYSALPETPTNIKLQSGLNTITSNANNGISIKYWTH